MSTYSEDDAAPLAWPPTLEMSPLHPEPWLQLDSEKHPATEEQLRMEPGSLKEAILRWLNEEA
jgi:hypothetical protein